MFKRHACKSVTRALLRDGGAGVIPAPTVTVWMGEVVVKIYAMPILVFSLLKQKGAGESKLI